MLKESQIDKKRLFQDCKKEKNEKNYLFLNKFSNSFLRIISIKKKVDLRQIFLLDQFCDKIEQTIVLNLRKSDMIFWIHLLKE